MADSLQDAIANAASQIAQTNATDQAVDASEASASMPMPSSSAMPISRKNRKPATLENSIKKALFGGGSLSAPTLSLPAVRADVRNALKFDPSNPDLQLAQQSLSSETPDVSTAQTSLLSAYKMIGGRIPRSSASAMLRAVTGDTESDSQPTPSASQQVQSTPQSTSNSLVRRNVATPSGLTGSKSSSGIPQKKRIVL